MSVSKSTTVRLSEKTKTILTVFTSRHYINTGEALTIDQAVLRAIEAADPDAVELGEQLLTTRPKKNGNGESKVK